MEISDDGVTEIPLHYRFVKLRASVLAFCFAGAALAQTPTVSSVLNIASADARLSPGVVALIQGTNLAADMIIRVGGRPASATFALGGGFAFQLPVELSAGATTLVVTRSGLNSAPFDIMLDTFAPGLVPAGVFPGVGGFFKTNNSAVTAQNPVLPGESVYVQGVGLGATNPVVGTGMVTPTPPPRTTTQPSITVAGEAATVTSSALLAGAIGLYQVTFTVPANAVAGSAPVVLTIGGKTSNTLTLAVGGTAPPVVTSVVNGASLDARLSPGVVATVFGSSFGSTPTVQAGGRPCFVISATAGQINVQIPVELAPGATTLVVTASGRSSLPFGITLDTHAPGLTGTALRQNNSPVSPTNTPVAGEIVGVYALGLGPTNPVVPTGVAAPVNPAAVTVTKPEITVAGSAAEVFSSVLVPGLIGFYQISFRIPPGLAEGTYPVALKIAGKTSNSINLPVSKGALITRLLNNASQASPDVTAPSTFVSLYGLNFGTTDILTGFPATDFGGVSVTFNGIRAPLFHVIPSVGQIDALTPSELPETGNVSVQVRTPNGVSSNFTVTMAASSPGFYGFDDPSKPSRRVGVVQFNSTTWLVMAESAAGAFGIPGCQGLPAVATCGQPAKSGDVLLMYLTGLGRATAGGAPNGRTLATGEMAPADGSVLYQVLQQPTVTIGGARVTLLFCGVAPGFAGLYQIALQLPEGVAEGDDVPLVVQAANGVSHTVTIAIRH